MLEKTFVKWGWLPLFLCRFLAKFNFENWLGTRRALEFSNNKLQELEPGSLKTIENVVVETTDGAEQRKQRKLSRFH